MNPIDLQAGGKLHPASTVGATLSMIRKAVEDAKAEGVYFMNNLAPREVQRNAYIQTRDVLAELEAKSLLTRLAYRSKIDYLKRKLAEDFELVVVGRDFAPNVVTTVGKNIALDAYLAGSGYTVTGPYVGLIGAVSYTGVPVVGDTMASHGTWTEAGTTNAPTYTGPRKTAAWSAASSGSKALSAALSFAITGTGTAKGCFLVYGSGAVSTIDSTAGTLYSAGLFAGGDQPVVNGNTLNVSYTASL